LSRPELREAVAGAGAVLTLLHDRVDGPLLDAAGAQLRCVANVAVGFDNIDVAAATARGVAVTNTPGVLTDATADLAMALILAVTRRVGEAERLVRAGGTWSWDMFFMLGTGLTGKVLGVVGLGAIGRAVARRALAFGMKLVYSGPRRAPADVERGLGGAWHLPLDELLATADVVTLHCPLTPATRHLIDARALALMRPSAFLVNTARGPVVDENALVDALRSGALAGAALDVYEREPEVHSGLLELGNVVLLPHLGSATVETRTAMAVLAAQNAIAVLEGRRPPTPVNPEVL
jgi:glyoxylate reductase